MFEISPSTCISNECYTEANISGLIYCCNPYYRGNTRYDWATVKLPMTSAGQGGGICIGRIMGMFKYVTTRIPTYKLVEMDGDTDIEHYNNKHDETVYVVLHCETTYFDLQEIQTYSRSRDVHHPCRMHHIAIIGRPRHYIRNRNFFK